MSFLRIVKSRHPIFASLKEHLIPFRHDISEIEAPKAFDFPFYYRPHRLAELAAKELQDYLLIQNDWQHNFGLDPQNKESPQGKMFGVLVVKDSQGRLAYLTAFSGRLAGNSILPPFVPPVFDTLVEGEFYRKGEKELSQMNERLEFLEASEEYKRLKAKLEQQEEQAAERLAAEKASIREARKERRQKKEAAVNQLSASEFQDLELALAKESTHRNYGLKKLKLALAEELAEVQRDFKLYDDEIQALREGRKNKSNALQKQIFKQFQFLNAHDEKRSLFAIFQHSINENPPAGAGDCAAPKLLHYAYQHKLEPICMAEFWWGVPPKMEVRKHKEYYPACRGKCEPILGHMLQGLKVAPNPMLEQHEAPLDIEVIYEDDDMLAINKPNEFLSVPGKRVEDSVFKRMQAKYPKATGPLIVHRLDMSTSGIMLLAKTRKAHKALQYQFKVRSISKRYVAILDGILEEDQGLISLPLRVDLNDRPRQLVCYEYGKAAVTKWEVLERKEGKTKVYFYPITGRTHQLRVHAAHGEGLALAILGDDLYGRLADRLYLHAERISFKHPISGEAMTLEAPVDW